MKCAQVCVIIKKKVAARDGRRIEMPREFEYEVVKTYGSLSESDKGWKKEIKLISWNNREPKYDIREWSPDGEKMGKGVTLSREEIENLKKLLDEILAE